MKTLKTCIFIICLLCMAACEKQPRTERVGEGMADVEIALRISVGALPTKAEEPAVRLNNLMIWLVRDGELVQYLSSSDSDYVTMSADGAFAMVRFGGVARGTYRLYAAANIGMEDLKSDISAYCSPYSTSIDEESFRKIELKALGNTAFSPVFDEEDVPMSAIQDISVSPGANHISMELLRVCGKIRLTVYNQIKDKNVFIESLRFSEKNPVSAYLFPGNDGMPSSGFTRFADYEMGADAVCIPSGGSFVCFEQMLYEAAGLNPMEMTLAGGIYDGSVSVPQLDVHEYRIGEEQISFEQGKQYMVKSHIANRYWHATGSNSVEAREILPADMASILDSDGLQDYLWVFEGENPTIRSVGKNMYLRLSEDYRNTVPLSDNSSVFTYNDLTFCHHWRGLSDYYKYIYLDGTTLRSQRSYAKSQDADRYKWYFYPVTREPHYELHSPEKRFRWQVDKLTYIDKYGAPAVLDNIRRNEILDIKVNIFYNDVSGKFYYEVSAWDTKDNEMDFN